MTFVYGTNMELVYSLPAIGATQTGSAATVLNTAATSPPFFLPALQNIWSPSAITGKGLLIVASGGFSTATNTLTTLRLSFDPSSGTTATNTVAVTGALAQVPNNVNCSWQAQVWLSCVGVTSEVSSNWYAIGTFEFGSGSTPTTTSATFMWGGPSVAAGVPAAVTLGLATAYTTNLVAQWQVNPGAMVCSQFMVFGLN